jgi:hypothetical protein
VCKGVCPAQMQEPKHHVGARVWEQGCPNTATGAQAPHVINYLFITQKIIFLILILLIIVKIIIFITQIILFLIPRIFRTQIIIFFLY